MGDLAMNNFECAKEMDYERAFVMLMRFSTFFIDKVAGHKSFKTKAPEKNELKAECAKVLDETAVIKRELLRRYAAEARATAEEEEHRQQQADQVKDQDGKVFLEVKDLENRDREVLTKAGLRSAEPGLELR